MPIGQRDVTKADSDRRHSFRSKLWVWQGDAAWHFVTLPKELSAEIRFFAAAPKRGFGAVKVEATVGASVWRTSIFPSKRENAYLLPVKADVRRAEKLVPGKAVAVSLKICG